MSSDNSELPAKKLRASTGFFVEKKGTDMTTTETQRLIDAIAHNGDPAREAVAEAVNAESPLDVPEKALCEMKFTVLQDNLLSVLTLVMKAVSGRSTVPILSHVLVATCPSEIDGRPAHVVFTCSNGKTSISSQCDAKVAHAGVFTIPARPLLESVKTFSKGTSITVEIVETRVHVYSDKHMFRLKGGTDAGKFPICNEMIVGEGVPFALNTDVLRQAMKEVQFATAESDPRPECAAVCVHIQEETLTLAATDGFRLAVRTITMPTTIRKREASILVPVSSLRLLMEVMPHSCQVVVQWNKARSQAIFQAGHVQVAFPLIDGKMPTYTAIIPTARTISFTLLRADLNQIVKTFKVFAQDPTTLFTLTAHKEVGSIGCLAASQELGEASDEIDALIEGEDGEMVFPLRDLIDLLKYVPVDAFVFRLTTEDNAGVITPLGREDYSFVLRPMNHNR